MNNTKNLIFFLLIFNAMMVLTGCRRSSDDVWEDTKTAGRHVQKGFRSLLGQQGCSRQVCSRDEFNCYEEDQLCEAGNYQSNQCRPNYSGYQEDEFVPLQDQCNQMSANDYANYPSQTPGEPGSSLPGIHAFKDPSMIPELCGIFQPMYFSYNCDMIKGDANLQTAYAIAEYMRYHPNVYIFVEGHTDQRGPHAYNQTLGVKRCNAVRNFLIEEGVNPENVFTISYGKERPVRTEEHEESWALNRRAEFKVYGN